jgi:DnaK suppressor protein
VDTETYRQRLIELERDLNERVTRSVSNARDTSDDQPDPNDQSVVGVLRDQYFGLAQTDSEILANVRAAIGRLDDGTFGTCVIGGEAIGQARLDAVPWTPYCVQHQDELEARSGMRTPRA